MRRNRTSRLCLYILTASTLIGCRYRIGDYQIEKKAFDSVSRQFGDIAKIYDEDDNKIISTEEANKALDDLRGFINRMPVLLRRRKEEDEPQL